MYPTQSNQTFEIESETVIRNPPLKTHED